MLTLYSKTCMKCCSHLTRLLTSRFKHSDHSYSIPGPVALTGKMSLHPSARIGDHVKDIETPALVVDLEILEFNMKSMQNIMKQFPSINVRPHSKAHKSPVIAHMQQLYGAEGVCCQTLSEAEAMFIGGIKDILISNEVVGQSKIKRLVSLSRHCKLSVCVDNKENIRALSVAAKESEVNLNVLVEVNVGQNRCGVEPGEDVVKLAKLIGEYEGVTFAGIQCYNGTNQHVRDAREREAAVHQVIKLTELTLKCLKSAQIPCETVTGGGTGTFLYEASSGVFTEIQPGSYIFMDADYNRNLNEAGDADIERFRQSLYVLTRVQSCHTNRVVVDAGLKALSMDSGPPNIRAEGEKTYASAGDEHGVVIPPAGLVLEDILWLIPGHCDPTVNMYDWLVALRKQKVEQIWPITARGPGV